MNPAALEALSRACSLDCGGYGFDAPSPELAALLPHADTVAILDSSSGGEWDYFPGWIPDGIEKGSVGMLVVWLAGIDPDDIAPPVLPSPWEDEVYARVSTGTVCGGDPECAACDGHGHWPDGTDCPDCEGSGYLDRPALVYAAYTVRPAEQGDPASPGRPCPIAPWCGCGTPCTELPPSDRR